jgi:hypothetical protein
MGAVGALEVREGVENVRSGGRGAGGWRSTWQVGHAYKQEKNEIEKKKRGVGRGLLGGWAGSVPGWPC